jgi:glyoxylase-like metal-dependent hydrolase (beta-lactamase superfamily II)
MKKIILAFIALVSVALSAAAQAGGYDIYAIKFASLATRSAMADWALHGPKTDSLDIDFMVWLIRGKNGRNVLVDAGFWSDLQNAKDFGYRNYVRPDSMLAKLSLKAGDITDIIISHPHWDHIDGIDLFPNAHIWMQKDDYNYFVGAAWQKDGNHGGFVRRDVQKLVDLNTAGKLTLVDGDNKEIFPGIKVYTGSRHTFNSQFVVVETGKDKIVLASDNIWIYYSLEHLSPPSSGGTFDTTAFVNSMRRMKTLASDIKYIIPGHDSRIFSLFPAAAEGVAKIH